ncbi:MAG: YrbL family protein [Enterobacterales bacterium endosymbiont of Blomia tropicalis]|nr:YrbL family protein [Mixta mediterraneensis]MDL4915160.1 YrbL family protein [Mixta mediterraneensis]
MVRLELNSTLYIAKGRHRECYLHPDDDRLCVKIIYNATNSGLKESRREQAYYRFLEKRNIDWSVLPACHGKVETNLGTGMVFDFVRDFDGKPSRTLEHYLHHEFFDGLNNPVFCNALAALKVDLLKNRIISMTLKSKNILYRKESAETGRLVIVDNIGNSSLIPVASYSDFFGKRKIERTWARFINSLSEVQQTESLNGDIVNGYRQSCQYPK